MPTTWAIIKGAGVEDCPQHRLVALSDSDIAQPPTLSFGSARGIVVQNRSCDAVIGKWRANIQLHRHCRAVALSRLNTSKDIWDPISDSGFYFAREVGEEHVEGIRASSNFLKVPHH